RIRLVRPEPQSSSSPHPNHQDMSPFNMSSPFNMFDPAIEYLIDAGQRSVLISDVMRQRGNQYREHLAETAPHVLDYDFELIVDGRQLDGPVNYALVRIVPPAFCDRRSTRRPRSWYRRLQSRQ